VPDESAGDYHALQPVAFIGRDPLQLSAGFGGSDPVREMIGLATINAMCQHVMKATGFPVDCATDSLGLLAVSPGDKVGMVGLFSGLIKPIREAGADLVIIEKNRRLMRKYPDLPITPDTTELRGCNKILSTSTTVLNRSLDEILEQKSPEAFVSIVGPTAGYFPDPLFACGVDVVGGRVVDNGEMFLQLLADKKRWSDATRKTCFRKETYAGSILSEYLQTTTRTQGPFQSCDRWSNRFDYRFLFGLVR
jgi:uncharacterized protein (DUF4213/DUF364 family)